MKLSLSARKSTPAKNSDQGGTGASQAAHDEVGGNPVDQDPPKSYIPTVVRQPDSPLREVVLDTETTGFSFPNGDRLVEIGCVELHNHVETGNTYHCYINPERSVPKEAYSVHGLGTDFLKDKPLFHEVAESFLEFIGTAPLVIHNKSFDLAFLNGELRKAGYDEISNEAIDTADKARRKFPRAKVGLDSLCNRFKIDKTSRSKHGALIDSELLAKVYLELLGGANYTMPLDQSSSSSQGSDGVQEHKTGSRPKNFDPALVFKPTEREARDNKAFREKHGL